jgi:hypothetical protein
MHDNTLTDEEKAALTTAPMDYESAIEIIKGKSHVLTDATDKEPIIHSD